MGPDLDWNAVASVARWCPRLRTAVGQGYGGSGGGGPGLRNAAARVVRAGTAAVRARRKGRSLFTVIRQPG